MDKERERSSAAGGNQNSAMESHSKEKQSISKKKILMVVFILLFVLFFFWSVRYAYLFFTESKISPDEPYPVQGVDVSSYQMEIDWKSLEEEGVRFAFIKATEGTTFVDSHFEYNWEQAHETDMKVGAYHFLSYDSSGESQAQNYIDTVNKKWGMLPPVVDVEFYGDYSFGTLSKEEMYAVLDIVLEMLEEEYGKTPIIYTNRNIYKKYISGRYDEHAVWISCPDYIPEALSDGREWLFCQYTFTGTSPSIAGGTVHVDYNVFNGSKWDFRRYKGK